MNDAVLSAAQAQVLLQGRSQGDAALEVSLTLGFNLTLVSLGPQGVQIPAGGCLPWAQVEAIAADENGCYILQADDARKIQFYSDLTGRAYSLYPTRGAPTMLVSGLPMHRIKDTDPHQDTLEKIRAARPVAHVLDTCTGLGYTAIQASKLAAHVTTIELDPAALEVCRANPWSQELFTAGNITQIIGDSFEEIAAFPEGSFSRVIHDPPYLSLAGDLYSLDFYHEAFRVLTRNGRMFHYIGDPESKSGRSTTAGVIKRLEQAGFRRIERAPRAFGVVASK
jgi:hypothetical protein